MIINAFISTFLTILIWGKWEKHKSAEKTVKPVDITGFLILEPFWGNKKGNKINRQLMQLKYWLHRDW